MKGLHLFLGALAALVAVAGSAQACTSGRIRAYFSYERPTVTGQSAGLLVSIPPGEVREAGSIRARLLSGARDMSDNGYVRIRLGEAAFGTNCVELGPTDGPVFVVGTLQRNSRGELVLTAEARPQSPRPIFPRGRRDRSFYDQYIVDPAYLSPAERRRREARPQ
jgi:hypothetical protein